MIFSPAKPDFDFTAPHRFIQKITHDRTNLDPSAVIFEAECRPYKLNWLFVFCLSSVLTNNFKVTDQTVGKNYFGLANKDAFVKFRTWHEGVRAGVQTLVALHKLPIKGAIVWPGTEEVVKKPPSGEQPIDAYYGEGTYAKAEALYNDLMLYEAGDEFEGEPVVTGPEVELPPLPPLPKIPESVPSGKIDKPAPDVEKKPSGGWKKAALGIAGVLGSASFIIGLFAPGWVKQAVDLIIKLIQLIAGCFLLYVATSTFAPNALPFYSEQTHTFLRLL